MWALLVLAIHLWVGLARHGLLIVICCQGNSDFITICEPQLLHPTSMIPCLPTTQLVRNQPPITIVDSTREIILLRLLNLSINCIRLGITRSTLTIEEGISCLWASCSQLAQKASRRTAERGVRERPGKGRGHRRPICRRQTSNHRWSRLYLAFGARCATLSRQCWLRFWRNKLAFLFNFNNITFREIINLLTIRLRIIA